MVGKLLEYIYGFKTQAIIYGSLFLFVVSLVLRYYLKGRKEGQESLRNQINAQNEKIRSKWDKIDATPTDFNTAVERLRNRVGDTEGTQPKP